MWRDQNLRIRDSILWDFINSNCAIFRPLVVSKTVLSLALKFICWPVLRLARATRALNWNRCHIITGAGASTKLYWCSYGSSHDESQ